MDLTALLTGATSPGPGVEVRRARAWPAVVVTAALIAFGVWAFDYALSGQMHVIRGKTVLGLVAWPFIVLWWGWNCVRGLRLRRRGHFGWALSDTHFGYVSPAGSVMGPYPLTAIRSVTLRRPKGGGAVLDIEADGQEKMHPLLRGGMVAGLYQLSGDELGLLALRPSSSKALFRALEARLRSANPAAQIMDLGTV